MDPTYPPEADAYREKVQAFLAEHLPAGWKGTGALDREQAEAFTKQWRDTHPDAVFRILITVGW